MRCQRLALLLTEDRCPAGRALSAPCIVAQRRPLFSWPRVGAPLKRTGASALTRTGDRSGKSDTPFNASRGLFTIYSTQQTTCAANRAFRGNPATKRLKPVSELRPPHEGFPDPEPVAQRAE